MPRGRKKIVLDPAIEQRCREIAEAVCARAHIAYAELFVRYRRGILLSAARCETIWRIRSEFPLDRVSMNDISRFLRTDHTSVRHHLVKDRCLIAGIDRYIRAIKDAEKLAQLRARRTPKVWRSTAHRARTQREIDNDAEAVERAIRRQERYREMIAALPRDNRDLTATLMGDPLPGRSAYDRRMSA